MTGNYGEGDQLVRMFVMTLYWYMLLNCDLIIRVKHGILSFPVQRFTDLTRLVVIGGKLDKVSPQEVSKKFADELGVTLLNSRGMVGISIIKWLCTCISVLSLHCQAYFGSSNHFDQFYVIFLSSQSR